jgi:hypothetical protein
MPILARASYTVPLLWGSSSFVQTAIFSPFGRRLLGLVLSPQPPGRHVELAASDGAVVRIDIFDGLAVPSGSVVVIAPMMGGSAGLPHLHCALR